jgi:hypothetical protein
MPTVWRGRHRLIFCWLIFMQAVSPGRKTLEEMARWTPAAITAWRFGRVLKAAYWNVPLLVSWLAQDLVATLPAPANGLLYLFGDGSHADKRGTKNPVAQKGRISQHHPWFFGLRFVVLMAAWDGYRIPVGMRLILPKRHAGYRSENALFREMVEECVPPRWAKLVIVGGDAAYGSRAERFDVDHPDFRRHLSLLARPLWGRALLHLPRPLVVVMEGQALDRLQFLADEDPRIRPTLDRWGLVRPALAQAPGDRHGVKRRFVHPDLFPHRQALHKAPCGRTLRTSAPSSGPGSLRT